MQSAQMTKCPRCGQYTATGTTFCPKCGSTIAGPTRPTYAAAPAQPIATPLSPQRPAIYPSTGIFSGVHKGFNALLCTMLVLIALAAFCSVENWIEGKYQQQILRAKAEQIEQQMQQQRDQNSQNGINGAFGG